MAAKVGNVKSWREKFTLCLGNRDFIDEMSELRNVWQSSTGGEVEKKLALDQAFRDTVKDKLIEDAGVPAYRYLIGVSIEAVLEGFSSPNVPFLLLSDVLDSVTLDLCDQMFTFVEERVSTWTKPIFFSAGKNLLLRMCNDLLRRLSTSQSTVFCGRIQLFLASLFPLSEKSGLNLMSQFNLENVTIYTQRTLEEKDKDGSSEHVTMDVDEREAGEIAGSMPIDYNLYKKFWDLQDFFRNPPQCYTPKKWKIFVENTNEVLNVFSSHKLEHVTWKKKAKEMMKDMKAISNENGSRSSGVPRYFAKYLTNEKLLDLQLSDSNFRRTILVQILVLFQYLLGSVKFKSNSHVLSELQSLWVKETTSKVYELIKETPPDGEKFAKTVEHIFEREENWISWKNEGCPSFTRERVSTSVEQNKKTAPVRKRKRSIGDEIASTWKAKKVLMGSPELTRLWNLSPDNLEACKAENRVFLPTLEKFFEEAIDQDDPKAMIEDEYKVIKNSNFGWRALRLLARRSQHFFQPSSNPFKTLPEYLQSFVHQLATELPTQTIIKTEDSGVVENGSCPPETNENLT